MVGTQFDDSFWATGKKGGNTGFTSASVSGGYGFVPGPDLGAWLAAVKAGIQVMVGPRTFTSGGPQDPGPLLWGDSTYPGQGDGYGVGAVVGNSTSEEGNGVTGNSTSGTGVNGNSTSGDGVLGRGINGVHDKSSAGTGSGVLGENTTGTGVLGSSAGPGAGVLGENHCTKLQY